MIVHARIVLVTSWHTRVSWWHASLSLRGILWALVTTTISSCSLGWWLWCSSSRPDKQRMHIVIMIMGSNATLGYMVTTTITLFGWRILKLKSLLTILLNLFKAELFCSEILEVFLYKSIDFLFFHLSFIFHRILFWWHFHHLILPSCSGEVLRLRSPITMSFLVIIKHAWFLDFVENILGLCLLVHIAEMHSHIWVLMLCVCHIL